MLKFFEKRKGLKPLRSPLKTAHAKDELRDDECLDDENNVKFDGNGDDASDSDGDNA